MISKFFEGVDCRTPKRPRAQELGLAHIEDGEGPLEESHRGRDCCVDVLHLIELGPSLPPAGEERP